jgi:predicted MFS family arabinose efflux permease
VLLLTGLGALVFGVIESGRHTALAVAAAVVALLAFIALVAYERRRREPLLDLRFFRSVPFSSATMIAISMFAAQGGFLFLTSLYLQDVRGLSPFHAGLCILPLAVAVMLVSPISGRLVGVHGARPSLLVSGALLALSALLLTRIEAQTSLPALLAIFAIFGIGFGMVNAPITFAAVSGMPRAQAGVASAVASTSRQIGVSVGVALAGAVAGAAAGAHSGTDWTHFPEATHVFWWILVGCGGVIFVLGFLSTGAWARASTRRIAHLLEEPQGATR